MPRERILHLLQHADTQKQKGSAHDFDFPLSLKGRQQVKKLQQHLQENPIPAEVVFCSKAKRAVETFQGISDSFSTAHLVFPTFLYMASEYTLLELLNMIDDHIESVLIVGHPPSLYRLLSLLILEEKEIKQKLPRGMQAANLVTITLPYAYGWQGFNLKQAHISNTFCF